MHSNNVASVLSLPGSIQWSWSLCVGECVSCERSKPLLSSVKPAALSHCYRFVSILQGRNISWIPVLTPKARKKVLWGDARCTVTPAQPSALACLWPSTLCILAMRLHPRFSGVSGAEGRLVCTCPISTSESIVRIFPHDHLTVFLQAPRLTALSALGSCCSSSYENQNNCENLSVYILPC
jgi:hypothetical protein